jgi:hypothetical protein
MQRENPTQYRFPFPTGSHWLIEDVMRRSPRKTPAQRRRLDEKQ